MTPENSESFQSHTDVASMEMACARNPPNDDRDYTNLLRYTLQLAAEREIAADMLAELLELLERNAPAWYADEQHERVESALELL